MAICASCRLALRRDLRRSLDQARSYSTKPTPAEILSKPTWSIQSLLTPSDSTPPEDIQPSQLHHLLRLSALPLPKSKDEERSMISTLQSQLHFVRAVQRVDTTGVEPLRAIRDETEQSIRASAITLDQLKDVLDAERKVGYYQRPKRVKTKIQSEAEGWDVLRTASRKAGNFFVVQSKKKE